MASIETLIDEIADPVPWTKVSHEIVEPLGEDPAQDIFAGTGRNRPR